MRTQMLGRVDIDEAKLADELALSASFNYAEQYGEFTCGRPWKTCMLWSCGGEVGDGVLAHYDTGKSCRPTVYGEQLPYLRQTVEDVFAVEHLLFARLVVMSETVLVPHRDFVEFTERPSEERATHRLHVPLATTEDCLFMEDDIVYRMPFGEVWSLDVTRMHSAAVLSDTRRAHLLLDFADATDVTKLVDAAADGSASLQRTAVERPPLTQRERDAVLALSGLVDLDNLPDVFGIVIKRQFRKDGGENYVWDAIERIGELSGSEAVRARIGDLYTHCTLDRDE
jgi:hypothetical protein